MRGHDENFKRTVVQDYLSGLQGVRASKHGVDRSQLRLWVSLYRQHGDTGLRKEGAPLSAQFKLSVLQRMWKEGLSHRQTIALFNLRGGVSVISDWERRYHEGGLDALAHQPGGSRKNMPKPEQLPPLPQSEDARALSYSKKTPACAPRSRT